MGPSWRTHPDRAGRTRMAQDVAPIERLDERPMGVDPAAIEEEFNKIWDESASSAAGAMIRVRVANFVALAHDDDKALDRFEDVMQELPRRHPCRGILALGTPGQPSLDARISAHCFRSG